MASRRSVRIKSTSVLKKLKKKIGNKPKNSVGVQDINLKLATSNSQINTSRECNRTRRSSTAETKQKETKRLDILPRKTRNTLNQEDSRVKSCTVLAVKLKYPYIGRTSSVKLNSRSTKTSDSPKALPRTTAKPSETDLDVQDSSRKSSRMRKPTSKELKAVVVSTDKKSELEKRNGEVSQKLYSKSVKPRISNEIVNPGDKVKDDMECVSCGITPSQFFGKDSRHNTVCCFCSLVKPPQELKALLELLKLDCCLKFLNQKNQNALKTNNSPLRKRKINEHPTQAEHKNATTSKNSDVRSLRERNSIRDQKEQSNENSPKEQKKNTGSFTRPVRQPKGNANVNLNKQSSSTKSPDLAALNSTRISPRLMQQTFSKIKPSTKTNKQTPSSMKDIHRNLKRKMSPQHTQTLTKRRKLAENVEVKKKMASAHTCGSCNSTFAMQWKLKLHELTHADKSYPNVILRHAEVEKISDVTNQNVEGECSEPMDCDPSSENTGDTNNLNVQVSKIAEHSTPEGLQEGKTNLDNENPKEDGDELKHSEVLKQGKEAKSTLEDNDETVNKDSSIIQNMNISDAAADEENTKVNQETEKLDSREITTNNSDTSLDKDNAEVNEEPNVPTKCIENPTLKDCTDQLTKPKEDAISKESNLSSNLEDKNSPDALEDGNDKEQTKINSPNESKNNRMEATKENESKIEKSKALDTVSAEDVALEQSEIQNTSGEATEKNETGEESEETSTPINPDEEAKSHELSDNNENKHAEEENEETSNEISENTAGESTEMHKNDKVDESLEKNQNCGKESVSVENKADHCEQEDSLMTIQKESNSENTAEECRSEAEETETDSKHDDQHKALVSESNELKVNGIVTNDGNGSKIAQSANQLGIMVTHNGDNNSQHPADEKMTDLYNKMNIMFEGDPVGENKAAETETEKKLPDHHLENGDSASVLNDEK